jgi:hypothetical protein
LALPVDPAQITQLWREFTGPVVVEQLVAGQAQAGLTGLPQRLLQVALGQIVKVLLK